MDKLNEVDIGWVGLDSFFPLQLHAVYIRNEEAGFSFND